MYRSLYRMAAATCCMAAGIGYAQAAGGRAGTEPARPGVQVLSSSQMGKADGELLAARAPEIGKAAELYGYDVSSGTWIQNQVLCPDAPNYLLMHYVKIAQDGGVSLFTSVIPRTNGRVRIIPVLYHGAQAFHIFGSSPEQRELINQVVPANGQASTGTAEADLATLAYCYAALAGAEPASTSVMAPEQTSPIVAMSPEGKIREMNFSVIGPDHLFQDWRILFDRQSQVKSIALATRPVTPAGRPAEGASKERPVPAPR